MLYYETNTNILNANEQISWAKKHLKKKKTKIYPKQKCIKEKRKEGLGRNIHMANGPGRRVEWRRVGWFIRGKDCLVHDSETQLRNSAQLLFALRFELQWFSLFKTSFPSYYFSLLQPKKLHPNDHRRFNTGTETQPTPNPATTETTHHLNPVTTDSTQPKTAEKETEKREEGEEWRKH